jgi:hypothetical protein
LSRVLHGRGTRCSRCRVTWYRAELNSSKRILRSCLKNECASQYAVPTMSLSRIPIFAQRVGGLSASASLVRQLGCWSTPCAIFGSRATCSSWQQHQPFRSSAVVRSTMEGDFAKPTAELAALLTNPDILRTQCFIGGEWVPATDGETIEVETVSFRKISSCTKDCLRVRTGLNHSMTTTLLF